MQTRVVRVTDTERADETRRAIRQAGEVLRAGGLVAFPTETVYGLGGDALNPASSRKIYAAKGRPSDNPLIVHIARLEALEPITAGVPERALRLAEAFWPGPLTMILPKSELVPKETTGGLSTVAVRMPDHPAALALIEAGGGYVAAPSANTSGRPSPTLAAYVLEDLDGKIDLILDGGEACIGLESTIVDLTAETPMILRPGAITRAMLEEVLGEMAVDPAVLGQESGAPPRAPGMKYRHYAPRGKLTIVSGKREAVISRINALVREAGQQGQKTGVIATRETADAYRADAVKCAGSRQDEPSIARALYRILREFDGEGTQVIYSEDFSGGVMGQAIMNRLLKAAGHSVLRLEGPAEAEREAERRERGTDTAYGARMRQTEKGGTQT